MSRKTRDTKAVARGEEAAAQPPRAAGRQAIDATRAAATKLLRRRISASGWGPVGSLCILQSPLPLLPVSTRADCPSFLPPHFLASLSPLSVPAPRAGSRCWTLWLPLVGDARPTKGPGSRRRPSARSTSDGGEMGDRLF